MSEDKRQDEDDLELAPDLGDEDLMSDFKDLFPEDEETQKEGAPEEEVRDPAEALDELDAFLDDFEQGFDPAGEAAEAPGDEGEAARQVTLEEDELDLAVSQAADEETFGDDWAHEGAGEEALSEPESGASESELFDPAPEPERGQQELEIPADDVVDITTAAPAAAAAIPPAGSAGGLGRATMLAIAGMVLALLLSAVSLWFGIGAGGRLAEMEQKLVLAGGGESQPLPNARLQAEVRNLAARVNELAVIIEGPISHLRQSTEESLTAIEERLSKLEQGGVVPTPVVAPAAPARKLVEKAPAQVSENVVPEESAARKGGWVINLISLRSEKDAQEEMLRLRKAGVRVELQRALREGRTWYRLRVPGFTSYEGAKAYIETVEKQAGVKNAWVAKE